MIGRLLKNWQPFARTEPEKAPTLELDPVWAELHRQEREAKRRHKTVLPVRRAKAARVNALLRGVG